MRIRIRNTGFQTNWCSMKKTNRVTELVLFRSALAFKTPLASTTDSKMFRFISGCTYQVKISKVGFASDRLRIHLRKTVS